MNNYLFEKYVINYYSDLPKILKGRDIHVQHNRLFFCPMHDNYNTPAAKIFKDPTGWAFYCFSCQKQYGSYNVLKEVYKYNMKVYFKNLWNALPEDQKIKMKDSFGEYDLTDEVYCEESFEKFRNKQVDYQGLLNNIYFELLK